MGSPKINKITIELEDGPSRVYIWEANKLTMAELVASLNILGKQPEKTRWTDSTDQ